MLVLKEGTSLGTLEIVTLAVGIPYTLFWCILGWCMVGTYIVKDRNLFMLPVSKIFRNIFYLNDDSFKKYVDR